MTPEQIRALVQSEIQQANAYARYQLTPVQTHTHDGINSPNVFQPILTYVGTVGSGSAIDPVTVNILPVGWSITYVSSGTYTIIHGLDTDFYTCVVNAYQSTNVFAVPVIETFAKETSIILADVATGAKVDTGFTFSLTVVNNKKTTLPTYYGNFII